MASYISNWTGNFTNPLMENVGTSFAQDLTVAAEWFNNTVNIDPYSIDATSNYASGNFYYGGSFQMYGSGFTTTYTPTVTRFVILTPQFWNYDFNGSLKVNANTGATTGYFNHVIISSPNGESLDLLGKFDSNSYDASITSITYHFADGIIAIKGALIYHDLSGTVTGKITSFGYTDITGHGYQLAGVSIQYDQLDLYTDLDSFVSSVMVGNDVINGTVNVEVLRGFAGNDTLDGAAGADTLQGGQGNDTYIVDNAGDQVIEAIDEGTDLVKVKISAANGTYTLTDNVENGTLINTVAFNLTGNILDNILIGNAAANTLLGDAGNDTLDGGAGIDTLNGGEGDDTYTVNVAGDIIIDSGGADSVIAKLTTGTYTLAAGLENLTLFGAVAINGTGNDLDNVILGNAAANILNGGIGADNLTGGNGSDTYVVDNIGDVIIELNALAAGGVDLVQSAIDWTLGDNLEKLTLTGTDHINGTGNALANTITGNGGNNILDGGAGNDVLIAGDGDDLLDGGLGNDTMTGGMGDDQYIVDSASDIVTEFAIGGHDVINTTLTTFTLGANVEDLVYGGSFNFTGTGNAANNYIEGDSGADRLNGGVGIDTLSGGAGSDIFIFSTALNGATNVDTITDFTAGDKIQLSKAIFATVGLLGNLNADFFYSGTSAHDVNDHIIYNSSTGALYYDADGTGASQQVQFVTLLGVSTLSSADFIIGA